MFSNPISFDQHHEKHFKRVYDSHPFAFHFNPFRNFLTFWDSLDCQWNKAMSSSFTIVNATCHPPLSVLSGPKRGTEPYQQLRWENNLYSYVWESECRQYQVDVLWSEINYYGKRFFPCQNITHPRIYQHQLSTV